MDGPVECSAGKSVMCRENGEFCAGERKALSTVLRTYRWEIHPITLKSLVYSNQNSKYNVFLVHIT